jgi:hypothetical protein
MMMLPRGFTQQIHQNSGLHRESPHRPINFSISLYLSSFAPYLSNKEDTTTAYSKNYEDCIVLLSTS